MSRHKQVVEAIAHYGLKMHPSQLSSGDTDDLNKWVAKLLDRQEGVSTREIVEAVRHGMPRVWPFSEDGRPFDGRDVFRNFVKARSSAATMRRQGRIPITGAEARARFKRMVAEADHGEE